MKLLLMRLCSCCNNVRVSGVTVAWVLTGVCTSCPVRGTGEVCENGTIQSNECHSEMPQVSASSFCRLQIFLPA